MLETEHCYQFKQHFVDIVIISSFKTNRVVIGSMLTSYISLHLMLQLLLQGRNPGIAWEYSMPQRDHEQKPSAQPSYTWVIVRSECSVSCGGGRSLLCLSCWWAQRCPEHSQAVPCTTLVLIMF